MTTEAKKLLQQAVDSMRKTNQAELESPRPNYQTISKNKKYIVRISLLIMQEEYEQLENGN